MGDFGDSNSISDGLLRINDVSSKISDFIGGFSENLKKEVKQLKDKNKSL